MAYPPQGSESKPLIVVDGMPFVGDLKSINPATVTKVTVLKKDAAAASIYGAELPIEVIVINTLKALPMVKYTSATMARYSLPRS